MKRPITSSRKTIAFLSGLAMVCVALCGCSTGGTSKFAEGVRVMTGKGGTVEERDTIKEIVPDARDLSTYQPKPEWQTVFRADATDFLEFVSADRFLVGAIQLGSALSEPDFGGVELYDARTGARVWEGKRKNIPNGSYAMLAADPVILLHGASTKQLYFTALDPKSGQTLWEYEVKQPGIASYDSERGFVVAGAHTEKGLELAALKVQDGAQVWSQLLPMTPPPKGKEAKPLGIATARDSGHFFVVADQVFKIALETGEVVWKTSNPAGGDGVTLYPTEQGLVLHGPNRLWLLDAAKGAPRWGPVDFKGGIITMSVPEDAKGAGFVIARDKKSDGWKDTIHGVALDSGKPLWERTSTMPTQSPLLYVSGKLFFSTSNSLECLDARTGNVRSSTSFTPQWVWAPINEMPDVLVARGDRVILASEKNGVTAFSQKDGKPLWRHPFDFFHGAHFCYYTKEFELSVAAQMAGQLRKAAEEDQEWWAGQVAAVNYQWSGYDPASPYAKGEFGATMAFFQSMLALSSAIESSLQTAAVNALSLRKQLELNNAVMLQARAFQGKYWVRPYSKRGTSVAIVDLDTGKRTDVQYSAPNIGMSVYGLRLPCIRITPDGGHFVTAEIGLDETKFEKYVKFKWGMPYPSVLSYDLGKLQFRNVIWDDTELFNAANNGDLEKVKTLVKYGAWIDSRDSFGSTALAGAARNGHEEILRFLIASGANINAGQQAGKRTAIEMAAYGGHASTVKVLLDAGMEPGEAVNIAVAQGYRNVVKVFKDAGLLQVKTVEDAIAFGTIDDVKQHIKDKKDADRPLALSAVVSSEGTTPLMLASYVGSLDAARYLLELGADVNLKEKGTQKENALMKASERGNTEIAKLLIGKGTDVNAADFDQMTALYKAAQSGHTDTVKLLLQYGAKPNVKTKIYKDTALIVASSTGDAEIVKLLLDSGANVNDVDKDEETALIKAAWKGYVAVGEALLKAGADTRLKDKSGNTALDAAKAAYMPTPENKAKMIALLEGAAK